MPDLKDKSEDVAESASQGVHWLERDCLHTAQVLGMGRASEGIRRTRIVAARTVVMSYSDNKSVVQYFVLGRTSGHMVDCAVIVWEIQAVDRSQGRLMEC